jgi:hypothetical protein
MHGLNLHSSLSGSYEREHGCFSSWIVSTNDWIAAEFAGNNSEVAEHPDSHYEVIPFLRIFLILLGELGRENDMRLEIADAFPLAFS